MRAFRCVCPLVCAGVLAAIAVTGAAPSSSMSATVAPAARQHRHDPVQNRHRRDDGTSESTNWSGFAVTPTTPVTVAMGSWTVPTVKCAAKGDQYSSFWVGIDGWSSSTVEQTGTDSDCTGGRASYYAWYEFYPKPSYNINMPVNKGDSMTATVTYNGNGSFTVLITDNTNGGSFTTTTTVKTAARSSAEWIAEAPSGAGGVLTLADFGSAAFWGSQASVTTAAALAPICTFFEQGCAMPMEMPGASQFVQQVTMVQKNGDGALPGSLDATGAAFTDQYELPGYFTPSKKSGNK